MRRKIGLVGALACVGWVFATGCGSRTEGLFGEGSELADGGSSPAEGNDSGQSVSTVTCDLQIGVATLVSGLDNPTVLAVDHAYVYWANEGSGGPASVMKVPKCGGAPITLVPAAGSPIGGLVVDATSVYFTAGSTVSKVPLGGGPLTTLASGQGSPAGIALYGGSVYWANGGGCLPTTSGDEHCTGSIASVPLGGGTPFTIAAGQVQPVDIAVDGTNVYWTSQGGLVLAAPIAGGTPVTIVAGQGVNGPAGIAVDGTNVYWAESSGQGGVWSAPLDGSGPPLIRATGQSPFGIALDATTIYWTNYGGEFETDDVSSEPLSAGGTTFPGEAPSGTILASGQTYAAGIVVDETSVYWVDQGNGVDGGAVMKVTPK